MHALQELEVDVHVERHLASALELFLLHGPLVEPGLRHALRQKLADAPADVKLREARLRFGEHPEAERRQAQLRHGAVEQDLRADVHLR